MPQGRRLALSAAVMLAVGLGLYLAVAHQDRPAPAEPAAPSPAPSSRPEPTPQRLISLSPAMTELLFELGAGPRVVGITDFCLFPPEAQGLTRCGGFINPNLERIAALRPDLIVLQGLHETVRKHCEATGLAYLSERLDTLADLRAAIDDLGRALGLEAEARRLQARLDEQFGRVTTAVAGREPVPVFLCTGRSPGSLDGLMTCGGSSFLSELTEIAGGRSIFADSDEPYPQPSLESLVERAPEVILDLRPGETYSEAEKRALAAEWNKLPSLPAVREKRVYVLTEPFLLILSPRSPRTAEVFAEAICPGVRLHSP